MGPQTIMMPVPAKQLIEQLPVNATDQEVSKLVARYLLEIDRQPHWFGIPHDIGPPAFKSCPVRFDWAQKKRVGIKTRVKALAERWIIEAALAGYEISHEVSPYGGRVLTMSIARARRMAERAQAPRIDYSDDDDIPF